MWRYGLLGMPIFGLALFYLLPFMSALLLYLAAVWLACCLYEWVTTRQSVL